jgi:hypothetical protein
LCSNSAKDIPAQAACRKLENESSTRNREKHMETEAAIMMLIRIPGVSALAVWFAIRVCVETYDPVTETGGHSRTVWAMTVF